MGFGKFWHDLDISEVFLLGLAVSFPAGFFNASRSFEFFFADRSLIKSRICLFIFSVLSLEVDFFSEFMGISTTE